MKTMDDKEKKTGFTKGDPNIKPGGGPLSDEATKQKLKRRSVKEKELATLLRKIKPHVAESIMTAARIMKNPTAQHQHQLKAATILLDNYQKLVHDVYEAQDENESEESGNLPVPEVQEDNSPVFSLRVINN